MQYAYVNVEVIEVGYYFDKQINEISSKYRDFIIASWTNFPNCHCKKKQQLSITELACFFKKIYNN